jgi:copper chaperone CopZ
VLRQPVFKQSAGTRGFGQGEVENAIFCTMERGIKMQTEILKVTGMTCGGCTSTVSRTLKSMPGVDDANVSLSAGEATVQYDERVTSPDKMKSAMEGAGYGVDATNSAPRRHSKGGCCG